MTIPPIKLRGRRIRHILDIVKIYHQGNFLKISLVSVWIPQNFHWDIKWGPQEPLYYSCSCRIHYTKYATKTRDTSLLVRRTLVTWLLHFPLSKRKVQGRECWFMLHLMDDVFEGVFGRNWHVLYICVHYIHWVCYGVF